jgi:hypothetical protein
MALTQSQLTQLATDINGQASLASARTTHDAQAIVAFYNAASATQIWRSDLRDSEVVAACVGADVAALSGANTTLMQMLITPATIDATSANIRSDFNSLFSGKTSLTNLTAVAQRAGTRLEALFSSGGPPAVTTVFGYLLTDRDVQLAMGWPV